MLKVPDRHLKVEQTLIKQRKLDLIALKIRGVN